MKSIFNDPFLINNFEKIIRLAQQPPAVDSNIIQQGITELFANLRNQLVFTQEGDKDTLDIFTDLKNLESFLLFLYQNKVEYKGKDIVGTYGTGLSISETAAGMTYVNDPDFDRNPNPPEGYVRYEREKKYQINVEGIWAYLDNLLNQVKSNPKVKPYVDNIVQQLSQVAPRTGGAPVAPGVPGAPTSATPGATAGQTVPSVPSTAAAAPGDSKKQALQAALQGIASIIKAGGPLYVNEIDFNMIKKYLKLYSSIIDDGKDFEQFFNKNYEDKYKSIPQRSGILNLEGDLSANIYLGAIATASSVTHAISYHEMKEMLRGDIEGVKNTLTRLYREFTDYWNGIGLESYFKSQYLNAGLNDNKLASIQDFSSVSRRMTG